MINNIQDFSQGLPSIESNITSYLDRLGVLEASVNDLRNKMSSGSIKRFQTGVLCNNGKIFVNNTDQ